MSPLANVCFWPVATCGPRTIVGRYRGIADIARLAVGSTRTRMTQSGHAQPIFAVMHNTALAQRYAKLWPSVCGQSYERLGVCLCSCIRQFIAWHKD
jgi:hypothetical protein